MSEVMRRHEWHRGSTGWKPELTKEHMEYRCWFADNFERYDFVNYSVSTDEAIGRKRELCNPKVWRPGGGELDPNIVRRKSTSDKKKCVLSGKIAHGFKGKLLFLYTETQEAMEQAKKDIDKENQGRLALNDLTHDCYPKERKRNQVKGRPPLLNNFLKNVG